MAVESYQTKAGRRWRYRFQYETAEGETVKIQKGGFPTKKAAEVEERSVRSRGPDMGIKLSPGMTTVQAYGEAWLAGTKHRVSPSCYDNYERSLRLHVFPRLGHVKLSELQPEQLDWLYAELLEHGKAAGRCKTAGITCGQHNCKPESHGRMAPKTVRHAHTAVHAMLQQAAERQHILRNVASLAHPPSQKQAKGKRAKVKAWTADQAQAFLAWTQKNLAHRLALILLFLTTGMRREEALGLRWQDVDWDRRLVTVWWTQTAVNNKPIWKEGAKSEAGERTIGLDAVTLQALRVWRKTQLEERMAAGPGWHHELTLPTKEGPVAVPNDFIWTEADGTVVHAGNFSRDMTRWQKAAGLNGIGVHGLRHTYATTALMNGADLKLVSERLGHASIAITLDTYRWVFVHEDHEVAERVAGVMLGGLDLGFDEAL